MSNIQIENLYTLILDEALWGVPTLKVIRSDIYKLLMTKTIACDESCRLVTWKDTEYSGLFRLLKLQVQDETMFSGYSPKEMLEAFPDMSDIFVVTYLFSGSMMRHCLNLCGTTHDGAQALIKEEN